MPPLLRVSITLTYVRNITRLQFPNYVQTIIPISKINHLVWRSQFDLYHSVNSPAKAKIFASERDYTVDSDVVQSNWLITKLSRDGRISEARQVFDEMSNRDVVTWATLISGYIKCGMIEKARTLFDRVDAKKDVVTWTNMVGGYMRLKRISEAEKLFSDMPHKNVVSWNTMIDGYAQNGRIDSALYLFEKMPERNVISWNKIITALSKCGRIEEACRFFDLMTERDVISWTAIIAGLSGNGKIDKARVLFNRMPERNVVSWNAMITGYANNFRLGEAFDLFQRMPERDLPSWNTMITGFIKNGDITRARKLFNEMPQKNVVSWTSMIEGYVQDGKSEEALKIFSDMIAADSANPNEGTFVSVLSACSNLAGLGEGQQIHQIICKTVYQDKAFVVSALINMYSKCGDLGIARKIFNDGLTSHRDLISWNGMMAAYAHHGRGKEAISLFNEMQKSRLKPSDVTYMGLLSACRHAGLVEEGIRYFDDLVRDRSIQVKEEHYACLVDLCGRAGKLDEAFTFIERLGNKSPTSVWETLLAGCNAHGNEIIGKLAAKKILEIEPENAGTYLLLSNIYASSGKWKEAATLRLKMKDKGLKKQPGCSWIEVGNRAHVFVVGDKSHCESKLIYSLLNDLHGKITKDGKLPNNDCIVDGDFSMT